MKKMILSISLVFVCLLVFEGHAFSAEKVLVGTFGDVVPTSHLYSGNSGETYDFFLKDGSRVWVNVYGGQIPIIRNNKKVKYRNLNGYGVRVYWDQMDITNAKEDSKNWGGNYGKYDFPDEIKFYTAKKIVIIEQNKKARK